MQTTSNTIESQPQSKTRRRVFSGVQPSGDPQLGNYLGAFKGWVDRQDQKDNFFCIVDLHAITVEQNPEELRRQTRELAAMLFACGIDPDKSTLFIQSHVTAHAEACWLLNCVTPVGWLERMTQYKDKATKQASIMAGLLDYPDYTRPASLAGDDVPQVLLSGHHADIRTWRKRQAVRRTRERRPDLLEHAALDEEERAMLRDMSRDMENE